jgi:type II secretory pathway pseudopilin PulG
MVRLAANARRSIGRGGFTRLEAIVVVLIVVVLASLILPGIMNARKTILRPHCLGNLRNLGVAFQSLEAANGRFPASGRWDVPYPTTAEGLSDPAGAISARWDFADPTRSSFVQLGDHRFDPARGSGYGMRCSWVIELLH